VGRFQLFSTIIILFAFSLIDWLIDWLVDVSALYAVSQKKTATILFFRTWTYFNNFWYTESWGNATPDGCKFVHLTWSMSPHYLVKFQKVIFFLSISLIDFRVVWLYFSKSAAEIITVYSFSRLWEVQAATSHQPALFGAAHFYVRKTQNGITSV